MSKSKVQQTVTVHLLMSCAEKTFITQTALLFLFLTGPGSLEPASVFMSCSKPHEVSQQLGSGGSGDVETRESGSEEVSHAPDGR